LFSNCKDCRKTMNVMLSRIAPSNALQAISAESKCTSFPELAIAAAVLLNEMVDKEQHIAFDVVATRIEECILVRQSCKDKRGDVDCAITMLCHVLAGCKDLCASSPF